MNVFISVPMRGLTDQQIDDEMELVAGIAKAYFPLAKLEFVSNFETEPDEVNENVKHESVWHLGEALKCLSTCDAIMCPNEEEIIKPDGKKEMLYGCLIETATAKAYHIPVYKYDISVLEDFLKGDFHGKK